MIDCDIILGEILDTHEWSADSREKHRAVGLVAELTVAGIRTRDLRGRGDGLGGSISVIPNIVCNFRFNNTLRYTHEFWLSFMYYELLKE